MNRQEALKLLHSHMVNPNLRKHCYAVEAVMGALYRRLEEHGSSYAKATEDKWRIAGLLHDADYELTKETAKTEHTKKVLEWLKNLDTHTEVTEAIASHAWGYLDDAPEPKTPMQWALYCCDELTGLIVAVALVKPDKKLASVTVESVMNKWDSRSFAAGVNRDQIKMCESKLNIPLAEFISITLSAMQSISVDLGL